MASLGEPTTETVFEAQLQPLQGLSTRAGREDRAARATQPSPLAPTSTDRPTRYARLVQQGQAKGLRNRCIWPAHLGQVAPVDATARHPAVLTGSTTSATAVPDVDEGCGHRARQPRLSGRQAACRGCRVESWQLRPPRAARSSGDPQSDFEAAPHDFEAAPGCALPIQRSPRSRDSMVHPWGPGPHGTCSGPGLESLSVPDLWRLVSTTHRPTGHVTRNRTGSSPPRPSKAHDDQSRYV